MDEKDRKTLNDNIYRLSENCNFENILGFLEVRKIFTERQLQHYRSDNFKMKSEELKCQDLLRDIQTRGPKAFSTLLNCFKKTGHVRQFKILNRSAHLNNSESQPIRVKKSTAFASGPSVYKMTSFPRGYYIFINNIDFDSEDRRQGAEHDRKFAEVLDDMGYYGEYHENKTKQEMRNLLLQFSEKEELLDVDSCIIAISSHGNVTVSNEVMIEGCDSSNKSDTLLSNEIISYFNNETCKLPKGRPKIFFIQACRGVGMINVMGNIEDEPSDVAEYHSTWKDTFVLYPCTEGFRANRNPDYGSWLFQAATEVFINHAHDKALNEMKDLISDLFEVYFDESRQRQQILSYCWHGVTKKLYFNPGLFQREVPQDQDPLDNN